MTAELKRADIQLIQRILPHRYPFLLVDKVVDINGYTSAIGVKNVTMNDHCRSDGANRRCDAVGGI